MAVTRSKKPAEKTQEATKKKTDEEESEEEEEQKLQANSKKIKKQPKETKKAAPKKANKKADKKDDEEADKKDDPIEEEVPNKEAAEEDDAIEEESVKKVVKNTKAKSTHVSGVKGYTREQYAKYKSLVKELENCKIPELKNMLSANDLPMWGNKGLLVFKVADGKTLGKIPKCPKCHGGNPRFNYKAGTYFCPGIDRNPCFKKFTMEELPREEWKD